MEQEVKKQIDKKKGILFTILVAVVLITIGGVTFAFFNLSAKDNNVLSATLEAGTLSLTFEDNDASISSTIEIGGSIIKKFKITNTGTKDATLSLEWYNLVNTYHIGSLTYTLSWSDEENGTYTDIPGATDVSVPVSIEPITAIIYDNLSVPANATNNRVRYYNLEVTLNILPDVDQTDDLDAHFSTLFRADLPQDQRYTVTLNPNGGVWNGSSEAQTVRLKMYNTNVEIPSRSGYAFTGWYDSIEGGTLYGTRASINLTGDQTLYAHWTEAGVDTTLAALDKGKGTALTSFPVSTGNDTAIDLLPLEDDYGTSYYYRGSVTDNYVRFGKYPEDLYDGNAISYEQNLAVETTLYSYYYTYASESELSYDSDTQTYTFTTSHVCKYSECWETLKGKYIVSHLGSSSDTAASASSLSTIYYVNAETTKDYLKYQEVKTGTISDTIKTLTMTYLKRYYTYADSYTYDKSTQKFSLVNPQICQYESCYNNLKGKYVVTFQGNESSSMATSTNLGTIYYITNTSLDTINNRTVYNGVDTYTSLEECTSSNTLPGYQCFASSKSGKDMYWRIIRVDGAGNLRMIYTGTSPYANGTNTLDEYTHTKKYFATENGASYDAKYVGYMYGPEDSGYTSTVSSFGTNALGNSYKYSTALRDASPSQTTASTTKEEAQSNTVSSYVKYLLDSWYKTYMDKMIKGTSKKYSDYIADAIYCNDRSITSGSGYGTSTTYYGALGRFVNSGNTNTPIFTCPNGNDMFTVTTQTVNSKTTNGALTYPIGLITADEVAAAGGKRNTNNSSYYLYRPAAWYWASSPSIYSINASVFGVNTDGGLNGNIVYSTGAVAPVISLSAEIASQLTVADSTRARGIFTNPFYIEGTA